MYIIKIILRVLIVLSFLWLSAAQDASYFEVIYDDLLHEIYQHEDLLSSPPSATGAIGINKEYDVAGQGDYFLEQQRYGADWIAAGILSNDFVKINTGRLILDWAFDRSSNASFYQKANDAVHSTSLFLEAATRAALLLLENNENYHSVVGSWKPHLAEMGNFVARESSIDAYGRDANLEPFAHRYFLRAAGLQGVSLILRDVDHGISTNLSDIAKSLVEEGLSLQRSDGIFPERGGFDFNYQGIGLCYLGRWSQLMPPGENLNQAIFNALLDSLPLFSARVDSLGNVDISDSTRINEVARSGRPKKLDYKTIAQGFIIGSLFQAGAYESLATLLSNPVRPIVEYLFEGTADGQKSTGVDDIQANLFCRTANNAKNLSPLGDFQSGLTSMEGDRALELTSTTNTMGSGNGPFCRTDRNVDSLDGLLSFTLSGYYKVPQCMTGNIELFKTDKMKLTVVNGGKLRLFVDSHSGRNSVVSSKDDWKVQDEWAFFAVTYDGTQNHDNVVFYSGLEGVIIQSSIQTLDRGSVASGSSRLYINRQNRPIVGHLDAMRIYGSKTDDRGVLSYEHIRDLYVFDITPH